MKNKALNTENIKAVTVEAKAFNVAEGDESRPVDLQVDIRDSLDRIDQNTALLPKILQAFGKAAKSDAKEKGGAGKGLGTTQAVTITTTETGNNKNSKPESKAERRPPKRTGRVSSDQDAKLETSDLAEGNLSVIDARARQSTSNGQSRKTRTAEGRTKPDSKAKSKSGDDSSATQVVRAAATRSGNDQGPDSETKPKKRPTRRSGSASSDSETTDSAETTPTVINTRATRRSAGNRRASTVDNTSDTSNTENTSIDTSNTNNTSPTSNSAPASASNESEAQRQQEQRREDQRSKTLFAKIKGLATSLAGRGASAATSAAAEASENKELNDSLGTAAGGSLYGAAKEITDVVGTAKDSTFLKKGFSFFRKGFNRVTGRSEEQETEPPPATPPTRDPRTGRFLSRAERQSMSASALRSREREQNQDSTSARLEENDQNEERRHRDLVRAIAAAPRSGGGQGGGFLDNVTDWFGGGDENSRRNNNRGNRRPRSRFGRALDKGKNLLGRAGGVVKNVAGKAAIPLAGLLAGYSKYSEVEDDESLTGNQKAVQVGSTATGAMGGALAGAAAGAAIGSVVPFVGTAIGGIIGGVIGGLGGEKLGSMIGEGVSNKMAGPEVKAIEQGVLPELSSELSAKLDEYNKTGQLSLNSDESQLLKQRQAAARQNPELAGSLTHFERQDLQERQEMDEAAIATLAANPKAAPTSGLAEKKETKKSSLSFADQVSVAEAELEESVKGPAVEKPYPLKPQERQQAATPTDKSAYPYTDQANTHQLHDNATSETKERTGVYKQEFATEQALRLERDKQVSSKTQDESKATPKPEAAIKVEQAGEKQEAAEIDARVMNSGVQSGSVSATPAKAITTVGRIEAPKPDKPVPINNPTSVNLNSDSNSAPAASKQAAIDESKLGAAIVKAMDKSQQNKPEAAQIPQGPILTEFEDTTLTLMAYDRI